jgi:hypothetical protein
VKLDFTFSTEAQSRGRVTEIGGLAATEIGGLAATEIGGLAATEIGGLAAGKARKNGHQSFDRK